MLFDLLLVFYFLGTLLGLWLVFSKAGIAPWKSLIPIYNIILWIKLCGKDWKWYIYFLIPAVNVFTFLLLVVETCKCYRRYGFVEQTFAVIFPWIYLPCIGFSKKLNYTHPNDLPEHKIGQVRDWLDAIVFALVAAVIIRGNIVEFYNIPSSSMEKSLLTGDYLMVSKMAYGPRASMVPLSFPLVHNVMPLSGGQTESYLDWIRLPYHRYLGCGQVERFDAVVFNYPEGDTVCTAPQYQSNVSYHQLVRMYGRDYIMSHPEEFGKVVVRPVAKKENFIKRCIGMPGEILQIKNSSVFINGKQIENPQNLQLSYQVWFKPGSNPQSIFETLGMSQEDMGYSLSTIEQDIEHQNYKAVVYLTSDRMSVLKANPMVDSLASNYPDVNIHFVQGGFELVTDTLVLYPHSDAYSAWTVDNYGPIFIPAKGQGFELTLENLPLYRRMIVDYEGNSLEVKDGRIYINGKETHSYTPKMDYYWMMGDNRHNSADSRYWGFVPEDHIVGKASRVVFSKDPDSGHIRWNRCFKKASSLN